MARFGPGGRVGIRNRLALLLGYRVRTDDMRLFVDYWARQVSEERGLRGKLHVIRAHRAGLRAEEAAKREKADDLVRYAGRTASMRMGGDSTAVNSRRRSARSSW